ncbi:MAG TPA: DDE transposase, partial [Planctomycetaceae bacterium]|nr:DDE transposase [Planctomycetaceae bacterium]
ATLAEHTTYRTIVAERPRRGRANWRDKPSAIRTAVLGNRRRVRSARGRALLRRRG